METIKIGDKVYEAGVRHAGDTLGLTFEGTTIEEIAARLSEESAPEIRVLSPDGATKAIYKNHALTRVYGERIGGVYRVSAALRTQTIEQKEAETIREQMTAMRQTITAIEESVRTVLGRLIGDEAAEA